MILLLAEGLASSYAIEHSKVVYMNAYSKTIKNRLIIVTDRIPDIAVLTD